MRTVSKFFVGLCVSFLLAACSGGSPEDTARKFVSESYNGNADKVIAMIHIPDDKKEKPGVEEMISGKVKAGVAKQNAYAKEQGGIDEITAEPAQVNAKDSKRANVKVQIRFKKGTTRQDNVKLINTDKGWKIWL